MRCHPENYGQRAGMGQKETDRLRLDPFIQTIKEPSAGIQSNLWGLVTEFSYGPPFYLAAMRRQDNPMPTRLLAPIDCSKIQAQESGNLRSLAGQ